MKSVRITAGEVREGDTLLSIGDRTINGLVLEVRPCQVGQRVSGPRGGQYTLNAKGARDYIVLRTAQRAPLALRTQAVTVLREAE